MEQKQEKATKQVEKISKKKSSEGEIKKTGGSRSNIDNVDIEIRKEALLKKEGTDKEEVLPNEKQENLILKSHSSKKL